MSLSYSSLYTSQMQISFSSSHLPVNICISLLFYVYLSVLFFAVTFRISAAVIGEAQHMSTSLPLGHTSLHPLCLPPFYLWEYAVGAIPGKDGIFPSCRWARNRNCNRKRSEEVEEGKCKHNKSQSCHLSILAAILILSTALELQQLAGWRSATAGEGFQPHEKKRKKERQPQT